VPLGHINDHAATKELIMVQ